MSENHSAHQQADQGARGWLSQRLQSLHLHTGMLGGILIRLGTLNLLAACLRPRMTADVELEPALHGLVGLGSMHAQSWELRWQGAAAGRDSPRSISSSSSSSSRGP